MSKLFIRAQLAEINAYAYHCASQCETQAEVDEWHVAFDLEPVLKVDRAHEWARNLTRPQEVGDYSLGICGAGGKYNHVTPPAKRKDPPPNGKRLVLHAVVEAEPVIKNPVRSTPIYPKSYLHNRPKEA